MTKRSWSLDSLVLIFSIIILAQLLVYVVPQGQFEREPYPDNPNRSMVVAETYAQARNSKSIFNPGIFCLRYPRDSKQPRILSS